MLGVSTKSHLALHSALGATSDISQVIDLFVQGERPCTSANGSCFAIAIENSNWDKLKLLLDHTRRGVNISTRYERITALMKFGHIPDAAQYLLGIGANVNAKDIRGDCALSHVIRHRDANPASVRTLINAGANVNTRSREENLTILTQYLNHHNNANLQIIKILLAAGADVDAVPIMYILSQSQVNLEIMKALIEAPSDLNVQNSNKNNILVLAVQKQKTHIVNMMIKSGADVNFQEKYSKNSVLMCAVGSSDVEIIKILIAAGADVNFQDKYGSSVLMHAIKYQVKNVILVVNMLLDKKVNLCVKDKDGNNALMSAVLHSEHDLQLVKALIKSGAPINDRSNNGNSALSLAVKRRKINLQVVKILINNHADINIKNKNGDSPLMLAVMNRNVTLELVRMLTRARANVLAENNQKQTILSAAIGSSNFPENEKEMLPILDHLLQLPELKHIVYAPHGNHPQQLLLKTVCTNYTNILGETLFEIFKLIVNSQLKNTLYLELASLNVTFLFQNDSINPLFGAVALVLNNRLNSQYVFALWNYVNVLLEAGFKMHEGVSPLTLFVVNVDYGRHRYIQITDTEQTEDWVTHPVLNFIDFLIEHGAHVGQQMLRIRSTDVGFQDLRVQLYLPDALLGALRTDNVRAVRQLLPYWGFPGLYLLLFTSQNTTIDLYKLFPVLIEHGGVPQGTELYCKVKQRLALKSHQCPLYLETFEQMHSSPLSLRELCRYQVRASLAAQASHPGHNLPDLVRELSPPGLKSYLLMQPPADLGLLVCDNLLLVEASQQRDIFIPDTEEDSFSDNSQSDVEMMDYYFEYEYYYDEFWEPEDYGYNFWF